MHQVPADLLHRLTLHQQQHLLHDWDAMTVEARAELVAQLAGIDFAELESLYARRDETAVAVRPEQIAPIPVLPEDASPEESDVGEASLRRGEVAALLVAGGQGSRLG